MPYSSIAGEHIVINQGSYPTKVRTKVLTENLRTYTYLCMGCWEGCI